MPKRLELVAGLPCNPHTFRRIFACLLRKAGVDTAVQKLLCYLVRWSLPVASGK